MDSEIKEEIKMDPVDRLYQVYDILTEAGDEVADHEAEYLEIINAVKSNGNEKKLACQFIPKFLKDFPELFDVALEAQLYLAEDEDVTVRRFAFKHLPGFCKVSKHFVPKIANILTQMLISEDSSEITIIQSSLMSIMEIDIRGTLQGILTQISKAEDEDVRKRAIEFLSAKFKVLPEDLLTKEVEEYFIESSKPILMELNGQDFHNLFILVSRLKAAKKMKVKISLVDIIELHVDDDEKYEVSYSTIPGFINLLNQVSVFFSPRIDSNKYVSYVFSNKFPLLNDIKSLENGNKIALDLFQALAEISAYIKKDEEMKKYVETVFNELLNYIPLPPDTAGEDDSNASDPNLHFTHIECLLFTFVLLLKCNDEFIMSKDNVSRFKDFKIRLQFLSRVSSRALKHIKESQKNIVVMDEESEMKALAERTLLNLNTLINDFFRSPPSFRAKIELSWKSGSRRTSVGFKRRRHESSSSDTEGSTNHKRRCIKLIRL